MQLPGEKNSARLVKFWWVLAATMGASAGAIVATDWGIARTLWAIGGIGLPLATAVGYLEWSSRFKVRAKGTTPVRTNRGPTPRTVRTGQSPHLIRRGQLHAVSRKNVDPPSSSGA